MLLLFDEHIIKWLRHYLTGRRQRVVHDGQVLEWLLKACLFAYADAQIDQVGQMTKWGRLLGDFHLNVAAQVE